jgi:hypothetical protein
VWLFSAPVTRAQFSRLDDLAAQIAKEVKPLKPHLVAVVDFHPPSGGTTLQSHYFKAVQQWKFKPAQKEDGTPVTVATPVEVTYRLF